jgi:ABC-2 type transport system ATP-binding protein/lipopolysaccharide transport system ATP-binding protein
VTTERSSAVVVDQVGKRFRRMRDRRSSLKELVVRGRARQVDDFWAIRDVTLNVPRGSVYGLIGHNGSGKSTLLKVVAGIYRPSQGAVAVDGRLAALIELGAGFHPDMTGRENVRLNGSILGLTRREIDAAIDEIIDFSGLVDFIDEPVKNYSSGMYVRLGFSVAVHMRPDVLLVDEVIAVGDEEFQRRCFDHLYTLRRAGRTIIVVSHSTSMMAGLCDEIAWLDHGRLVEAGAAVPVVDGYIASVNAVEGSTRRGAAGGSDPAGERPGSGQVRISSVELIGEDGEPAASVISGQQLRLRLAYQAAEDCPNPVFAISFQHETGVVVNVANSMALDEDLPVTTGTGFVDYVQEACRLNPGNYRVDVAVLDPSGTHAFDAWTDALSLVVRQGAGIQRGGLVVLPESFQSQAVVDV